MNKPSYETIAEALKQMIEAHNDCGCHTCRFAKASLNVIQDVEFKKSISSIIEEVAFDDNCRCGYLTGSIKDGVVVVENIYIPQQTPSAGATTVDEALVESMAAIQDQGAIIVGEVLSHGPMAVFESAISEIGRKELSRVLNRPMILLVVNNRGKHILFN